VTASKTERLRCGGMRGNERIHGKESRGVRGEREGAGGREGERKQGRWNGGSCARVGTEW